MLKGQLFYKTPCLVALKRKKQTCRFHSGREVTLLTEKQAGQVMHGCTCLELLPRRQEAAAAIKIRMTGWMDEWMEGLVGARKACALVKVSWPHLLEGRPYLWGKNPFLKILLAVCHLTTDEGKEKLKKNKIYSITIDKTGWWIESSVVFPFVLYFWDWSQNRQEIQ